MQSASLDFRNRVEAYMRGLQDSITSKLEAVDGVAQFREDEWQRPGGGGGRSRIMTDGGIFEKAGVNWSAVFGDAPEMMKHESDTDLTFFATGVSLVLHAHSPYIPTVHANFRYFEQSSGEYWFGGGMDLTPTYLDEDDARHFHDTIKSACDQHDPEYYAHFKKWCDQYFYIKHRKETRGVGGLFFDHLSETHAHSREQIFEFVKTVSAAFLDAYVPIVERHRHETWTDAERTWQLLRRGRYVEFNLVYDRGTRFGLETDGRTESILMSLPTLARWEYDHKTEPGSREEALLEVLRTPREWATTN